jgi:hypothetical protein
MNSQSPRFYPETVLQIGNFAVLATKRLAFESIMTYIYVNHFKRGTSLILREDVISELRLNRNQIYQDQDDQE